ncbi:hypothetical protein AB1N83_010321 [Pleurotus pulmonarius]
MPPLTAMLIGWANVPAWPSMWESLHTVTLRHDFFAKYCLSDMMLARYKPRTGPYGHASRWTIDQQDHELPYWCMSAGEAFTTAIMRGEPAQADPLCLEHDSAFDHDQHLERSGGDT